MIREVNKHVIAGAAAEREHTRVKVDRVLLLLPLPHL